MKPVIVTIEYSAGERRVRRRLGNDWICPLCSAPLQAEEGVPSALVRRLLCAECGGSFRIVSVDAPERKRHYRYK